MNWFFHRCKEIFIFNQSKSSGGLRQTKCVELSFRIPWHWKTPLGYSALVFIQYIWIHCGIFLVICTLPLFVCFCSLFEAFTLDINYSVEELDKSIADTHQQIFTIENQIKFKKNLTEIISFHSKAIEVTNRFSETYGFLIVSTFAVSSILFCSSLLGMNAVNSIEKLFWSKQKKNEKNWFCSISKQAIYIGIPEVLRFFVCLSVMMIYLIELCFLGNEVTIKFAEVNDVICNCCWYKFPLNTQKLLPLTLRAAQKPVYIKGYMNVQCTRESVKKVSSSHLSRLHDFRKITFPKNVCK